MRYFSFQQFKKFLLFPILFTPFAYADLSPISTGETPASLACIYGLTPNVPGCPIRGTTTVPDSGSGAIAIIDGQDDPNAFAELQLFATQFGLYSLPVCTGSNKPCFQQYYVTPSSSTPCISATDAQNQGNNASTYGISSSSDTEPEIDIEWAHAMAPRASIYMIETQGWGDTTDPNNPNISSLVNGIMCANYLLDRDHRGGIVSYSHSFQEWAGETAYDTYFQHPRITYIASSGDYSAPARYPATSPHVIGAGGTSIQRDSTGNAIGQVVWKEPVPRNGKTGATGGPSLYESRPSYQNSVQRIVGTQRGTPDISFVAQNVDVFCCQLASPADNGCCGSGTQIGCSTVSTSICPTGQGAWTVNGGTSLASPALAGVINSARSGNFSSLEELKTIYDGAIKNYRIYWTDIVSGNNGYPAMVGYDFTTGLGVPKGYGGK